MHTAERAIRRLALVAWMGLFGFSALLAQPARAATPPEKIVPESTILLFKLNDAKSFREAFRASQYGQLWNDPGLKDFREELSQKLNESGAGFKEKMGVSFKELIEIPQGTVALAAIGRDDPKLPVAGVVIADAGENEKKLAEVLAKAGKQAEEGAAKISSESFNGLTLHIIQFPPSKLKGDKEKGVDLDKLPPAPPLVWTNAGSQFFIGTDVEAIKDLAAHREGRDSSLAANDSFIKTQAKIDSNKAQVTWFIDLAKVIKLLLKASGAGAQAEQNEVLVQELGVNGLKSVGGSFSLGSGGYNSVSKTFFLAPKPVQGLLKVFSFPQLALRPESWVPATVASYQTISIDLDNVYTAVNDIVNKFQPGMLNIIEQQLVGPQGGQPLSFQNDLFGPLGNRVTIISDFKKPIKDDSQRVLLAIALEDSKAFQSTLTRVLEISQSAPQKREFQGTTIYDFPVNIPQPPGGGANVQGFKGPISLAIAKEALFVTTDTTLLEQVLRPGSATLADSTAYQTVAKEYPEKTSAITYVRPDESARISYDLIKGGQFEKALAQAAAAGAGGAGGNRDLSAIGKVLPVDKLPDFSVFAKYLSLGGGFGVMDDDGFTMTGFTLRRSNP
jgi:hypothetical protein